MSYYAVRVGVTPGIYRTWTEASKQVTGHHGSVYKKFTTRSDAEAFVDGSIKSSSSSKSLPTDSTIQTHVIYTDGSFAEGRGGYGWLYLESDDQDEPTTYGYGPAGASNNKGELLAIIRALEWVTERPVTLYSDSQYSLKAITEWYPTWRKNGYVTSSGKPPANLDLIRQARRLGKDVTWCHVKGHSSHKWNDLADQLANKGRLADDDIMFM